MKKTFSIPETISKMVGHKYNHFKILRINRALSIKKRKPFVDARCDCKDKTIISCNGWNFVYDLRFSCGCKKRDTTKKRYWKVGSSGYPKGVERIAPKRTK